MRISMFLIALLSSFSYAMEFENYEGYMVEQYALASEDTRNKQYQLTVHLPASYRINIDK